MIDEEIRQLWSGQLVPVSSESLPAWLSPETRAFLTGIGLPRDAPLNVTLDLGRQPASFTVAGTEYLAIGDDYGTQLGIEVGTDEVWSIGPDGALPKRFVNSTVGALVAFLGLYIKYQPALQGASDEEAEEIVAQLRDEFAAVDEAAVDGVENWWSVVLEQTALGLM